jgi:hypothetical protein
MTPSSHTTPSRRERRPQTSLSWPRKARVSPQPCSPPSTRGTNRRRSNTRTSTPTHGSPEPRRPHDRGHQPAPELLARPPTNKAPTFQGLHPGVPALRTGELGTSRSAVAKTLTCHATTRVWKENHWPDRRPAAPSATGALRSEAEIDRIAGGAGPLPWPMLEAGRSTTAPLGLPCRTAGRRAAARP